MIVFPGRGTCGLIETIDHINTQGVAVAQYIPDKNVLSASLNT